MVTMEYLYNVERSCDTREAHKTEGHAMHANHKPNIKNRL